MPLNKDNFQCQFINLCHRDIFILLNGNYNLVKPSMIPEETIKI